MTEIEKEIRNYCITKCRTSAKEIKNGKCIWLKKAKSTKEIIPTFAIHTKGQLYCARP